MQKEVIYSENASKPIGPYSQGIRVGNTYYFSGCIGLDPATAELVQGGVEAQTTQAMKNIGELLKAAGLDYSNIVKTSIFLRDMADFPKMNAVYAAYFKEAFPARETVAVVGLPKDALVEISVTCVK